ncbi:MAG: PP2C family protein-serine/threonine phosphatase [Planctomycetota bacterium]
MRTPRRDALKPVAGPRARPEAREPARGPRLAARAQRGPDFRIPIASKVAAFTGILIVVFISWQIYVAARAAGRGVEEEIDRRGIALATALSALIDPSAIAGGPGQEALLEALGEFGTSPGAREILNVVVWSGGEPVATARRETRFRRSEGRVLEDVDAAAAGVEIREFTYEGIPVRSFSRALGPPRDRPPESPEPAAAEPSRVEVYLAASAIEDSRRRLANAMLSAGATAGAFAIVAAVILARLLTAPIRALGRDMKRVSLGDLDHASEVRSRDEIGDLARTFNLMTQGLKDAEEAKIARKAAEHELALAARIQSKLLPSQVPEIEGYELAVRYSPAKEVSGDYYDFLDLDGGRLGVVIADVSGKGVPAALVMTMTRSLLRIAARQEASPDRTIELLHRALVPDLERGMFVTLVYLVLVPEAHEVALVRAGHNSPLFYAAAKRAVARIQPRGLGIGLDRQGSLFRSELRLQRIGLEPGDALLAYTDGLVEAKDREGKDYGEARLSEKFLAAAAGSAREILDRLAADLAAHAKGSEPADDVTIVVLKRAA